MLERSYLPSEQVYVIKMANHEIATHLAKAGFKPVNETPYEVDGNQIWEFHVHGPSEMYQFNRALKEITNG